MIFLSIFHELQQIAKSIDMIHKKQKIIDNRIQYARALQLFRRTLQTTRKELEDIYTNYVLKSQYHVMSPALCCLYMVQAKLSASVPSQ